MPRQARLDAPHTLHHVMVRGLKRRGIFADEKEAAVVLSREYAVTLTRRARNKHLQKGRSIEDIRAFCKAGCDPHFSAAKPLQIPDGTSITYAESGRRIGKGL